MRRRTVTGLQTCALTILQPGDAPVIGQGDVVPYVSRENIGRYQLWTLAPHISGDFVRGFDLDAPTSGVLCDFMPQRIQRVGTDPCCDSDPAPSAHDVSSH